ncbi:MAG: CDP-alcohol phosphatidyltransferase family protein [Kiritimatiellia bacterium]|jgi:CDP-diacylglycerol--glycerol-3-phosphate 3-phosphatidyltransferase
MNRFTLLMVLTFSRAPLVMAAAVCSIINVFFPAIGWVVAAVALLALSALTDLFDGFLARKWGLTSRLGALLDPLMDKVFNAIALPTAVFIAMYNECVVHALVLLVLDITSTLRDQWVSFLRSVGSEYGVDVKASWFGKLRTVVSFIVLVLVHLNLGLETLRMRHDAYEGMEVIPLSWMIGMELLLLVVTAVTGISYTVAYWPHLRRAAGRD